MSVMNIYLSWHVDGESLSMESISVVSEFKEVFSMNFPGMLSDKDIDF